MAPQNRRPPGRTGQTGTHAGLHACPHLGPYASEDDLKPLLPDIPVRVGRDIAAAVQAFPNPSPGTVGSVYARAGRLLELARIAAKDRGGGSTPPAMVLTADDQAFLEAVLARQESIGGQLTLPPAPRLPDWAATDDSALIGDFGWIRVALGNTSGDNLHDPGCRTISGGSLEDADHIPWWQLLLEPPRRICGVCNGPGVRDLPALAAFVAASDAWQERERASLEPWQITAVQKLVIAAAPSRDHRTRHHPRCARRRRALGRPARRRGLALLLADWQPRVALGT